MKVALLAALILVLAPMAIAGNDWPQFRYNETHQGLVPSSQNAEFGPFKQNWWINITVPGPPGSPSVRENIVYYGDVNGHIWALDAESGGLIWDNTTSSDPIIGAPAVGQDFVYVVNKGGDMYSFNRKTGQAQAGYPVGVGQTDGSIMFHETEDLLYIGSDDGTMNSYSAQGKYQKWTFSVGGDPADFFNTTCASGFGIKGSAVVYESVVMFGSTNKCFFGVSKTAIGEVSPENGLLWVAKAKDSIRSTPIIDIDGKKVIFGDQSGYVYSVPIDSVGEVTVTELYKEPVVSGLSSEIVAGPAIADGKLIIAARNGFVRALPVSGGTEIWHQDLHGQVSSSPAVANGHVLVGSFDRNMYMLKLSDGSIEEKRLALGEIETSPAISGTQGFWASKDGSLYSFGGVKPSRADLAVTGLAVPDAVAGKAATVRATIKNVGVLPSEATQAKLYVGAKTIAETEVKALQPGDSVSYSGSFTPEKKGKVEVRLFVDPARTVRESDESNNDVTITATVSSTPTSDTGASGSSSKEGGVPGFEAFALLAALGVALMAYARRGAKR